MAATAPVFAAMGVREIRAGLASKDFSAREIAESSLARVRALDGATHAFLETTEQLALQQAAALDAAVAAGTLDACGPLAGVPVAFKDNMNLEGTHTTCSSAMLANYVSPFTATCVQRTIEAGGIPLGKLNMDEFAFGSSTETSAFGSTRNPWDLSRVPGGSSGGSAAAVGAGLAAITLGSDTGGSIRQPGSFCGAVAVKPTYGVVSRYGVVAFGSSLDQVGPFTRSVEDAAFALNAIAGRDVLDCTSQDLDVDFTANLAEGVKGMRIGVVPAFMEAQGLTDEVKAKVEEAGRAKGFGPEARRRIMLGSYLLSAGVYDTYYYPAQQVRTLITQDYARAYEQVDCIVAPVSPRTAFTFGEVSDPTDMYLSDMFTISINIAGNGGMSLPVGLGAQTQLPVGVQLISPQFKDQNMLRVAAALETVYGPAPVAPAFAPGQPYPEGSMADIPDAADATPGVDLPGLCMDREPSGGVHQASSAAKRGLSERLDAPGGLPFQVEKAGE